MIEEYDRKLTTLYRAMYKPLLQYAKANLSHNIDLAEEAVQETFRIACSKPEAVCNSPNPEGWLQVTLRNVIRNLWREQTAVQQHEDAYRADHGPDAVAEDAVALSVLYGSMAETEEFHLMQEMVLEGKSQQEMADERKISLDACKKRIQRAKLSLRKKILN